MTITPGAGACPDEANAPRGAPGPVGDGERVVRCVPLATHLVWNQGVAVLSITAIRREDLEGKDDKSVSVLRDPLTQAGEIDRRATAQNRQFEWMGDAVVARAEVIELRQLVDAYQTSWRLVCVHADPTTDATDRHGACATHASILRSQPRPGKEKRAEWLAARSAIAAAFRYVAHISGAYVDQIP